MRLNGRDGVATVIVAAAGGFYAWHLAAPGLAFVGSTRWASVVLFVLGVGACVIGGRPAAPQRYSTVMSTAAAGAFVLTVVVLFGGGSTALAWLAGLVGAMWLVTTVRHVLGTPVPAAPVEVTDVRELQHH